MAAASGRNDAMMGESFDQWVERQDWPAVVKAAAREAERERERRGLNPLGLVLWQRFADAMRGDR